MKYLKTNRDVINFHWTAVTMEFPALNRRLSTVIIRPNIYATLFTALTFLTVHV